MHRTETNAVSAVRAILHWQHSSVRDNKPSCLSAKQLPFETIAKRNNCPSTTTMFTSGPVKYEEIQCSIFPLLPNTSHAWRTVLHPCGHFCKHASWLTRRAAELLPLIPPCFLLSGYRKFGVGVSKRQSSWWSFVALLTVGPARSGPVPCCPVGHVRGAKKVKSYWGPRTTFWLIGVINHKFTLVMSPRHNFLHNWLY